MLEITRFSNIQTVYKTIPIKSLTCLLCGSLSYPALSYNVNNQTRYSIKNCLYEAVIHKILENCRCLPNYALGRNQKNVEVCRADKLACAMEWIGKMGNSANPDLTRYSSVTTGL